MEKIDFYQKKKTLHNEMLQAIKDLFKLAGVNKISVEEPNDAWNGWVAYAIISPCGAESTYEAVVKEVLYEDGEIKIVLPDGNKKLSCEFAGDVVTGALDSIYDALFEVVSCMERYYYVVKDNPIDSIEMKKYSVSHAMFLKENGALLFDSFGDAQNCIRKQLKRYEYDNEANVGNTL